MPHVSVALRGAANAMVTHAPATTTPAQTYHREGIRSGAIQLQPKMLTDCRHFILGASQWPVCKPFGDIPTQIALLWWANGGPMVRVLMGQRWQPPVAHCGRVQRASVGPPLGQRWLATGGPLLAHRWLATVGPTVAQRYTNDKCAVGPTVASHR